MKQEDAAECSQVLAQDPVILVVDDHPLVPMALRDLIEHRFEGVRSLQAASIRQARSIYQDEPELVATVLDLRLPDVAGLEGISELHALRPDVPILVYTGLDSDPLRRSVAALGAAALVCKKETANALLTHLGAVIAERVPRAVQGLRGEKPATGHDLSPRQQQMWQSIAEGLSNVEIASRYQISLNTTKAHVRELLQRLGVRNRTEAATRYFRQRPVRGG